MTKRLESRENTKRIVKRVHANAEMPTYNDQKVLMILNSKRNNGYIHHTFSEKMLNSWCNVTREIPIFWPKKCNHYSQ